MKTVILFAAAALACLAWASSVQAAEKKDENKDPLAKFSEEQLVDIGFCFDEFCKAVANKDARLAAAFVSELPKDLAALDLSKDADKDKLLKSLAKYAGAQIIKAQKMHGMGEVTYTDKSGAQQTTRMQLAAGKWKIVL